MLDPVVHAFYTYVIYLPQKPCEASYVVFMF